MRATPCRCKERSDSRRRSLREAFAAPKCDRGAGAQLFEAGRRSDSRHDAHRLRTTPLPNSITAHLPSASANCELDLRYAAQHSHRTRRRPVLSPAGRHLCRHSGRPPPGSTPNVLADGDDPVLSREESCRETRSCDMNRVGESLRCRARPDRLGATALTRGSSHPRSCRRCAATSWGRSSSWAARSKALAGRK
jgi:hypothetical protein